MLTKRNFGKRDGSWRELWRQLGKKHKWDLYLRKDVLSLALVSARYSKYVQEKMNERLFEVLERKELHSSGLKFFKDQRDIGKVDASIFTYTDKYTRHFVRQSFKNAKVGAINQVFESPIAFIIFKIFKDSFNLFTDKKKWSRIFFETFKRL